MKKISNIATIDFDIMMWKDIEVYNDYVDEDDGIDNFIEDHPMLNNVEFDYYMYELFTRFLIQFSKSKKPIYFIDNHDEIIPIAEELNKFFNIWNFDHHHDIYYESNPKEPILNPDCTNWVKYLLDKKELIDYYWVTDDNYMYLDDDVGEVYEDKYNILSINSDLESIFNNADALIICESAAWVPAKYRGLYLTWQTIVEEINKK